TPVADRTRAAGDRCGRSGRGEEAHEEGELLDGADGPGAAGGIGGRHVVRPLRELTARRLVALLLEELVADAHLDVVRLPREEEQRLVLRFPAEAADGPVVAVPVGTTADAEGVFGGDVGGLVGDDRAAGNLLYESQPERRGGNPEDHVVGRLRGEVLLSD